jgi:hypothetical protein
VVESTVNRLQMGADGGFLMVRLFAVDVRCFFHEREAEVFETGTNPEAYTKFRAVEEKVKYEFPHRIDVTDFNQIKRMGSFSTFAMLVSTVALDLYNHVACSFRT